MVGVAGFSVVPVAVGVWLGPGVGVAVAGAVPVAAAVLEAALGVGVAVVVGGAVVEPVAVLPVLPGVGPAGLAGEVGPAVSLGPKTAGSTARVTAEPAVPATSRRSREPSPSTRCQAASRTACVCEKRSTTGSRVTGSRVATWIGSNSLREFQARKVRAAPVAPVAPSPSLTAPAPATSTATGRAAKASGERTEAAGTTIRKGRLPPAATVGRAVCPTVSPRTLPVPAAHASRVSLRAHRVVGQHHPHRGGRQRTGPGGGHGAGDRHVDAGRHDGGSDRREGHERSRRVGRDGGRRRRPNGHDGRGDGRGDGCVEGTGAADCAGDTGDSGDTRDEPGQHDPERTVAPAATGRARTPRPARRHAVPASRSRAACAMRRSLGKVRRRCTSSSRIHATSMASWSGSFSMESSPPVASSR